MKSSIVSSLHGGVMVLLLLASACSSDGAEQVIPGAAGAPGKAGSGGTSGSGGSATAGVGGTSILTGGSGGASAGAGSGGLGGGGATAGAGGVAGTGTGGEGTAGSGAASGSGGEATAGSGGNGGSAGGGAAPTTCAEIDADAEEFNDHCYLLVEEERSWRAANSDCEDQGGYLVTISSEGDLTQSDFDAENDFVWDLAGQMDVWIGATDGLMDDQGGNGTPSTWSNGEEMVLDGWLDGEPSNSSKDCPSGGGTCFEHCGFMWQDREGQWNDEVCAAEKRYVCEWELP